MQPISIQVNSIFWPKLIDIASDCHDQNIKLTRLPTKETLILQVIRDIPAGQPLRLWFSEDLMLTELGIPPYLSPFNIKGNVKLSIFFWFKIAKKILSLLRTGGNSYICHECREQFERPNLLKLHLALHCDRLASDTIWNRLKAPPSPLLLTPPYLLALNPPSTPANTSSPCPLLTISSTVMTSASPLNFNPATSLAFSQHSPQLSRSLMQMQISNLQHLNNNKELGVPQVSSSSTTSSTPSPIIGIEAPVENSRTPASANGDKEVGVVTSPRTETNGRNSLVIQEQHHHHARLEAIVSNMGKAKNGHVCLYCGKLYSRKYGLKIHIRTHTGYKPLRCKICHRPFGDPSNLNKHVRLHSDGTTPYRQVLNIFYDHVITNIVEHYS